jgi:hypothetical protein
VFDKLVFTQTQTSTTDVSKVRYSLDSHTAVTGVSPLKMENASPEVEQVASRLRALSLA